MRLSQKFLLIIVFSIVIISGCKNDNGTASKGPFKGGTAGVEISFLPTAPTSEFNKGDSEPVKIILKNKGEYDVSEGGAQVKIFGIHHPTFGISDQYKGTSGKLLGLSEERSEGGEQTVDMGTINYNQDIINFQEFDLSANVCYPYATVAQVNACISSITLEQGGTQKACGITGEKISKGDVSSAPVQITSFTERFRGSDQIWFDVTIENKGKGSPYNVAIVCSDLDDITKKLDAENIVDVKMLDENIQCGFAEQTSSAGQVRLKAKAKDGSQAVLHCSRKVSETSSIQQKIRVEIRYKYLDKVTKKIKIYSTTTST